MLVLSCFSLLTVKAQTETDAIMMKKNELCIGGIYAYSNWNKYWEASLKRNNENIGSVSSNQFHLMGTYGLNNKINLLFNVPYITTKSSAGTLSGFKGFQDISFAVKWKTYSKRVGAGDLGLFLDAGLSTPINNYVIDYQPLAIGMGSTNLTGRINIDYLVKRFYLTLASAYVRRSNIQLDRNSYYTDRLINSNQVAMPDLLLFNVGTGYRNGNTIAEIAFSNMTSLGGFDIRRNDMPFPSNRMNATTVGGNLKYNLAKFSALTLVGGGNYVIAGRNVGQNYNLNGGLFYIINFKPSKK
nr:hypothetical protein [Pseudopedobacter sp.]